MFFGNEKITNIHKKTLIFNRFFEISLHSQNLYAYIFFYKKC